MIEIVPAVLPKSFEDLKEHLERLRGAVRRVQVDVVDGVLARHKTWPYKDHSTFAKIVEDEHGLPLWEEFDFEFDLMIKDPLAHALEYVRAGASRIVLHSDSDAAAEALTQLLSWREEQESFTVRVGVAIPASAQPEVLEPFEAQFDFVQVMGIERIGRQGEPLDKHALYLVERLRKRYPELPVQVDGGVKLENAQALAQAGATTLIVGSAIFGQDDPKAAYAALVAEANRV